CGCVLLVASLALLALLASVVHAGPLRERHTCPRVCDASRCPPPSQLACYYGRAAAGCGCCAVCAAGEGDACGERSDGGLPCGEGLLCDSVPGKLDGPRSTCVCASSGPVCGSDGRTYPSVCRLGAENRRAELLPRDGVTQQPLAAGEAAIAALPAGVPLPGRAHRAAAAPGRRPAVVAGQLRRRRAAGGVADTRARVSLPQRTGVNYRGEEGEEGEGCHQLHPEPKHLFLKTRSDCVGPYSSSRLHHHTMTGRYAAAVSMAWRLSLVAARSIPHMQPLWNAAASGFYGLCFYVETQRRCRRLKSLPPTHAQLEQEAFF
uniref:IGFBP N-terminal domain-containing protein n=1 Tax=Cyclopterus lumpus TaxID=8103 RepID=A0A8C2WMM2_CYCLU